MENLEIILSLIVTIIGFITSTVTFIVKYIQSLSAKKTAEHNITITDLLPKLICEAENCFINSSGDQKKNFVLEKLRKYAEEKNLFYDEQLISNKIDEMIALTKSINK